MDKEISYTYSPQLAMHIARQLWRKNYAVGYLYYGSIPLLTLLLCLASGGFSIKGVAGFIMGFLAGIVSVIFLLIVYSYHATEKSIARSANRWRGKI